MAVTSVAGAAGFSRPVRRSTKRLSSPATGSESFQIDRVDCQNCRGSGRNEGEDFHLRALLISG